MSKNEAKKQAITHATDIIIMLARETDAKGEFTEIAFAYSICAALHAATTRLTAWKEMEDEMLNLKIYGIMRTESLLGFYRHLHNIGVVLPIPRDWQTVPQPIKNIRKEKTQNGRKWKRTETLWGMHMPGCTELRLWTATSKPNSLYAPIPTRKDMILRGKLISLRSIKQHVIEIE